MNKILGLTLTSILIMSVLYVSQNVYANPFFSNGYFTENGIKFLLDTKVTGIKNKNGKWKITLNHDHEISSNFIINAAGGESIDIAHSVNVAKNFTDVHFRGEYWKAPKEYYNLTKTSVYSVPEFPDYPFFDHHWIIRVDGTCEIVPHAVPVFSPFAYK